MKALIWQLVGQINGLGDIYLGLIDLGGPEPPAPLATVELQPHIREEESSLKESPSSKGN